MKTLMFDRPLYNMIENLQTECPLCLWKGTKSELRFHLGSNHTVTLPSTSHETFECRSNNEIRVEIPSYSNTNINNVNSFASSNTDYNRNPEIPINGDPSSTYPAPQYTSPIVEVHYNEVMCTLHRQIEATFNCVDCHMPYCSTCREDGRYGTYCHSCRRRVSSRSNYRMIFFGIIMFLFVTASIISVIVTVEDGDFDHVSYSTNAPPSRSYPFERTPNQSN
eukprot:TRINITY_DN3551_c0_g1_i1.p1 TRINITY_DN3551_c0_g1~~TRINITY_DN3551_c0_g1_i1.p1  ORF type:complete len:222 (-),score=17.23 TRINITY_DN3551_c0_g1_i1:50-715(-)